MLQSIVLLLLVIDCAQNKSLLSLAPGRSNKVAFVYPSHARTERDLFNCTFNSACNIIHKRFWLPPLIERLCQCPHMQECRWNWSDEPDNYTMAVDNRSQIKFCSDLSDLPVCTSENSAMVITTEILNNNLNTSLNDMKQSKPVKIFEQKNVTAKCYCEEPHYWKLKFSSTFQKNTANFLNQTFSCLKLNKCETSQFCGYVRNDIYSTYYRCSCPRNHYCISNDKTLIKIEEMLYNGFGYNASCFPIKKLKYSKV